MIFIAVILETGVEYRITSIYVPMHQLRGRAWDGLGLRYESYWFFITLSVQENNLFLVLKCFCLRPQPPNLYQCYRLTGMLALSFIQIHSKLTFLGFLITL